MDKHKKLLTYFYIILYIISVVLINRIFTSWPELAVVWLSMAGLIFIIRDMVQTKIGHWTLIPMIIALVISYFMSAKAVAIASAVAFSISESIDWIVFTISKTNLKNRLWVSSSLSIPIDSLVFLYMVDLLTYPNWFVNVLGKLSGVVILWCWMTYRERVNSTLQYKLRHSKVDQLTK